MCLVQLMDCVHRIPVRGIMRNIYNNHR